MRIPKAVIRASNPWQIIKVIFLKLTENKVWQI